MSSKPFSEMSLDELREEHAHWAKVCASATAWGAGYSQAIKWRNACWREIEARLKAQTSAIKDEEWKPA